MTTAVKMLAVTWYWFSQMQIMHSKTFKTDCSEITAQYSQNIFITF